MDYITKRHLTHIRVMMLEIRERINDVVEINESTVRSLYLNLITENYDTIMMYHGEEFTTAVMELYAECELYETCTLMRDKIGDVKKLIETLNDESNNELTWQERRDLVSEDIARGRILDKNGLDQGDFGDISPFTDSIIHYWLDCHNIPKYKTK